MLPNIRVPQRTEIQLIYDMCEDFIETDRIWTEIRQYQEPSWLYTVVVSGLQ